MRDFLKLDVIMQKVSKLLKTGNKAKKIVSAILFSWTFFKVVATIWSLLPKYEKLDEVDADKLIEALSCEEEPVPEDVIQPVTGTL